MWLWRLGKVMSRFFIPRLLGGAMFVKTIWLIVKVFWVQRVNRNVSRIGLLSVLFQNLSRHPFHPINL
jgi:hypothetical protein